jgi:hypothetical protein
MEQLESIQAVTALDEAIAEMRTGFNFERYGVPIDGIDLEHFRKALCLLELLRKSQS